MPNSPLHSEARECLQAYFEQYGIAEHWPTVSLMLPKSAQSQSMPLHNGKKKPVAYGFFDTPIYKDDKGPYVVGFYAFDDVRMAYMFTALYWTGAASLTYAVAALLESK